MGHVYGNVVWIIIVKERFILRVYVANLLLLLLATVSLG